MLSRYYRCCCQSHRPRLATVCLTRSMTSVIVEQLGVSRRQLTLPSTSLLIRNRCDSLLPAAAAYSLSRDFAPAHDSARDTTSRLSASMASAYFGVVRCYDTAATPILLDAISLVGWPLLFLQLCWRATRPDSPVAKDPSPYRERRTRLPQCQPVSPGGGCCCG